jgi:hypothetical protein
VKQLIFCKCHGWAPDLTVPASDPNWPFPFDAFGQLEGGEFLGNKENEYLGSSLWDTPGTLSNLRVYIKSSQSGVPNPPANTFTFTIRKNGVDTAITVRIVYGTVPTPVVLSSQSVSVAAGDIISMHATQTGTDGQSVGNALTPEWSIEFDTQNDSDSVACWFGGSTAAAGTKYAAPLSWNLLGFQTQPTTEGQSLVAIPGSITHHRIDLSLAPGAGTSRAFLFNLNGVDQDGSAGTPNTTITIANAATSGMSSVSLALVAGDLLLIKEVPTGAPTLCNSRGSLTFHATQPRQYNICKTAGSYGISNSNVFSLLNGGEDALPSGTATVETDSTNGLTGPMTLIGFIAHLNNTPDHGGGTGSWIFTTRQNAASTALVLTFSGSEVLKSIAASVPFVSVGTDTATVATTHTLTPFAAQLIFSFGVLAPTPTISYTTAPRVIRRLRRAPHISELGRRIIIDRFTLDMQTGVGLEGLTTLLGENPTCMLRWSNNGGQTWSEEVEMSAGELGHYFKRIYVSRLGQSRDRLFELTVSDPVAWSLMAAILEAQVLDN